MFGNNALSTLTVSLFAGETTLIIDAADAAAFPQPSAAGDYFLVTVEDLKQTPIQREICKCTGRTGNLFTVVRAQEGFAAKDFTVGTTTVSNRVTAATMNMAINLLPPADSKVYGQQLTTVGGVPTFVEVLTTQGQLTFGGPIGIGSTPPAGTPLATLYTNDVSLNGNIGFNQVWNSTGTPGWRYRVAGAGALWGFDPALGQLAASMSPSGAAGAAVTGTVSALRINAKGQVAGANVGLPLADDTRYTWTADNFALEPGGYFAFNTYLGAGSVWKTKAAGYSGLMSLDTASGNLNFFVNPSTSAGTAVSLTLASIMMPSGALQVQNTIFANKGISFGSFNSWEYQAYVTTGGDHILAHRAGWYDQWQSSGGSTIWVRSSANAMVLYGNGDLTVAGALRSTNAAAGVWASSDNSHGHYTSGGRWKVWQVSADGWRVQWDGSNGQLAFVNQAGQILWSVDGSGNVWASGNYTTGTDISARSLYASATVQGNYLYSTGNIQGNVDINCSRNVNVAGTVTSNVVHATGVLYGDQNGQFAGNVVSNAAFAPAGFFVGANNDTSWGMYSASGQRIFQFGAGGWYWQWDNNSGTLIWWKGSQHFWVMRTSDNLAYNELGAVGGNGAYANFSDRRGKDAITPTERGLAEVLQLHPVEFIRVPHPEPQAGDIVPQAIVPRTEIGFVAQDVAMVVPEAVVVMGAALPDGTGTLADPEPSLGMTYDTIVAIMVNAIKELNTRIVALEGGAP
jgi:hypothetical protein